MTGNRSPVSVPYVTPALPLAPLLAFAGLSAAASAQTLAHGHPPPVLDAAPTSGASGHGFAAGDWDADGGIDLVVGGTPLGFEVLVGDGAGTFAAGGALPTHFGPSGPDTVVAADFDGDGDADLAVTYEGTIYPEFVVGLYEGDGVGGFGIGPSYDLGGVPSDVHGIEGIPVDVDVDGDADLVYLARASFGGGDSELHVLENDGAGAFTPLAPLALTGNGTSVVTADWNGDGIPDLAVGTALVSPSTTFVLLGNGDGTFVDAGSSLEGAADVLACDVDDDGQQDLVLIGASIRVHRVAGGVFQPAIVTAIAGSRATHLDLDGDGRLDLAMTNGQKLLVLSGDGAGAFTLERTLATGPVPTALLAVQADGRGGPDVLLLDRESARIATYLGDSRAAGRLVGSPASSVPAFCEAAASGDFDEDGRADLVITRGFGLDPGALVQLGDGAGGFAPGADLAAGSYPVSLEVADWNGDAHEDVAIGCRSSNDITVFLGDGAGAFTPSAVLGSADAPFGLAAADFDEDGALDFAATRYLADGLRVYLGDGAGGFTPGPTRSAGVRPVDAVTGDWNQDGHADLVFSHGFTVQLLLGDGTGQLADAGSFQAATGAWRLAAGDFDGDGLSDVAVACAGSFLGARVVLGCGDGAGGFSATASIDTGSFGGQDLAALDLDLDGDLDLGVAHLSGELSILSGRGDGTFEAPRTWAAGLGSRALVGGFFDADARPDLVVVGRDAGSLVLLASRPTRIAGRPGPRSR